MFRRLDWHTYEIRVCSSAKAWGEKRGRNRRTRESVAAVPSNDEQTR